ncbi:unnamed protein product [Caretta caretta]
MSTLGVKVKPRSHPSPLEFPFSTFTPGHGSFSYNENGSKETSKLWDEICFGKTSEEQQVNRHDLMNDRCILK